MTKTTIARRVAREDGWVLVSAITLMSLMLILAIASMSLVDVQQQQSRKQRERESALNLAEGVLYAQGFKLAQNWPGVATNPAPNPAAAGCTSDVQGAGCPVPAEVALNVKNVDTTASTTWTTAVRDNGGELATAFQPSRMNLDQSGTHAFTRLPYRCPGPCRWDANGDRKVWVQARAVVRGRPRNVVATLKLERLAETTPQTAVTAGGINTGNQGSQTKIYAYPSQVVVRCDPSNPQCVSDPRAIAPTAATGAPPPMLTPTQLERFRKRAIADGRYYEGCPPSPYDLRGEVVFIEKCVTPNLTSAGFVTHACPNPPGLPARPSGAGNGLQEPCINTIDRPGFLIWHCGAMDVSGKATFVGVMYFMNASDRPTTGPCAGETPRGGTSPDCDGNANNPNNVFTATGGWGVWGAIAIDGTGCLYASANGIQVQFDSNVFKAVASYGTVGLVQDTWRELPPN